MSGFFTAATSLGHPHKWTVSGWWGTQPMVYSLGNAGIALLAEQFGFRRAAVDWTAKARTVDYYTVPASAGPFLIGPYVDRALDHNRPFYNNTTFDNHGTLAYDDSWASDNASRQQ